ncbi:hypothetical protein [Nitrosomonas communis]|uniref:Uncharacterized protein n=1 Tax=Nitrosomonas communis TaxID=44574 RepID=A0A1I4TLE4_9PROT|nr:hypothetical protein [Nitrosomonas communis]SFM77539.1 hypothetical protein SAMN05421863_105211 [Nitrosomonas communis]
MKLPGFTAELTLYPSIRYYQSVSMISRESGGMSIVPSILQIMLCDDAGFCWPLGDNWGPLFGNAPIWQGGAAGRGGGGNGGFGSVAGSRDPVCYVNCMDLCLVDCKNQQCRRRCAFNCNKQCRE